MVDEMFGSFNKKSYLCSRNSEIGRLSCKSEYVFMANIAEWSSW